MRLFVDNLTNIDFSYLCPTRGLVGETWLAHIELTGELNHEGMVCDFGIVKKELRQWLDQTLDHCLLVPSKHESVYSKSDKTTTEVRLKNNNDDTMVWCKAPSQAITLMDIHAIAPEAVAKWCIQHLKGVFGETVAQIHLSFSPESISGASYHYSHGLKKHKGDCQRIAHGHRSKILIWLNDKLCSATMQSWADKWADVYIASEDDCQLDQNGLLSFSYEAEQGKFELILPKERCYLIQTDTTVEYIAAHIFEALSEQHPNDKIRVQAFEGIGKGAIVD